MSMWVWTAAIYALVSAHLIYRARHEIRRRGVSEMMPLLASLPFAPLYAAAGVAEGIRRAIVKRRRK